MAWGPDEWDAFTIDQVGDEEPPPPAEAEVVLELLRNLPGRRKKTVADLGCGKGDWLPFLIRNFGQVVAVDFAPATLAIARRAHAGEGVVFRRRDLRDLTPFRGSLHVALLLGALVGPTVADVDRVLAQVRGCLVEGGMLIVSVPAVEAHGKPVPMRFAGDQYEGFMLRFTEVDLQYRLRRAGFLGVRIRRFAGSAGRPGVLLALATRRANN